MRGLLLSIIVGIAASVAGCASAPEGAPTPDADRVSKLLNQLTGDWTYASEGMMAEDQPWESGVGEQ